MATSDTTTAPCTRRLELYLDPRLEDPPDPTAVSAPAWRRYQRLVQEARSACAACPLLAECLYNAVVHSDVAGYVGCTTPHQRTEIRQHLGITVRAESLDATAGARDAGRPVEHAEVLRMRTAFPDDSLQTLADRLGCSLSTVKRHLRRARSGGPLPQTEQPDRQPAPTVEAVFDAFEAVVERPHLRSA